MDDLAALERAKSWRELLEHAEDVPPAARDAAWKRMLEAAAIGLLAGETDPRVAVFRVEELRKRFPTLQASRTFMSRRAQTGIDAFKRCYEESWSGADCTEDLLAFVRGDPAEPALAMQAGRLVIKNQFPYVAARFFKLAVAVGPVTHALCADPDLQRATAAAIDGLPVGDAIRNDANDVRTACKGK
jgi:hypothetical protein